MSERGRRALADRALNSKPEDSDDNADEAGVSRTVVEP
jgi:hypothetical protein